MILLIDHFDSFVHNLARYFKQLGFPTCVLRYDKIDIPEIKKINPTHLILSPGPCSPNEALKSVDLVHHFESQIPILGVCLGHQIIAQAYGGEITRAKKPMHGKSSLIAHDNNFILRDLPQPMRVGRYHSLIMSSETIPDCLRVIARSEENEIMAFAHSDYPIFGVQFHPESVLTEGGYDVLRNFLA